MARCAAIKFPNHEWHIMGLRKTSEMPCIIIVTVFATRCSCICCRVCYTNQHCSVIGARVWLQKAGVLAWPNLIHFGLTERLQNGPNDFKVGLVAFKRPKSIKTVQVSNHFITYTSHLSR